MKKSLALVAGLLISAPVWAGTWIAASGGYVPSHAYQVGVLPDGAPLFLCKTLYDGSMYIGNINPQFKGCDISVNGNILTQPDYRVWVTTGPVSLLDFENNHNPGFAQGLYMDE
jgi:hypothetical protein